jgi:glycosyltransferase involved in cell wall biosynthesis
MKVTGFSFIKDAEICDYPVAEAIKSILPLCDEVVVAVGKSSDNTLELVRSIHPQKIRILETVWDDNLREGGRVLALETDKAFQAIKADADWCVYIQADEIVHENSLDSIRKSMLAYKDDKRVHGLLLDFIHFYGSYGYVADALNWHRKEIRIVKNDKSIFSYKDSMGFRKGDNQKLQVKNSGGLIYHYSYVKTPRQMMNKAKAFNRLWHDDNWMQEKLGDAVEYDFSDIDSLKEFTGTHPAVMAERIARFSSNFKFDTSKSKMKFKYRARKFLKDTFGLSVGEYKNYKLI